MIINIINIMVTIEKIKIIPAEKIENKSIFFIKINLSKTKKKFKFIIKLP